MNARFRGVTFRADQSVTNEPEARYGVHDRADFAFRCHLLSLDSHRLIKNRFQSGESPLEILVSRQPVENESRRTCPMREMKRTRRCFNVDGFFEDSCKQV